MNTLLVVETVTLFLSMLVAFQSVETYREEFAQQFEKVTSVAGIVLSVVMPIAVFIAFLIV